tara:strand:- start:37 stop:321 length:285 start_codon:yes stop_codon:yes gene_type:complete
MDLSKEIFWDVDQSLLDFERNCRFVIERVITRGKLSDLRKIMKYYGDQVIIEEAKKIRALDQKSLHFLSIIFSIPIGDFRCYTQIQSKEAHWNY